MTKCWICKRDKIEIFKDTKEQGIDQTDDVWYKSDIGANICYVCKCIIEDITLDQSEIKFNEKISELKVISSIEI